MRQRSSAPVPHCASAWRSAPPNSLTPKPVRKTGAKLFKRLEQVALPLILAAILAPGPAAAIVVTPPSPEAETLARDRLLRAEAEIAVRLRQSGGDPRIGVELGAILGSERAWQLRHPSTAIVQAIAAARDPAALALAIVHDGFPSDESYLTDALLAALAVVPGRTPLWLEAARVSLDPAARVAFLGRAIESLPKDLLAPPTALPEAAIEAERLDRLLDAGLAREALTEFDRLPAALREPIAAGEIAAVEVDGIAVPVAGDLRLKLALARLISGDDAGARTLLARSPGSTWRADGPLLGVDIGSGFDPRAERTLAESWLGSPTEDDPFQQLAGMARAAQFWKSALGLAAFGRLAERQGYPALAAFAWSRAAEELEAESAFSVEGSKLSPPEIARAAAAIHAAIAAQTRAAHAAAAAAVSAAGGDPRSRLAKWRHCPGFVHSELTIDLFALDHEGRRGLVFWSAGDERGGLQLEKRDGVWTASSAFGDDAGFDRDGYLRSCKGKSAAVRARRLAQLYGLDRFIPK